MAHRENGHVAWEALRQRWTEAVERFPANTIVRMLDSLRLQDRPETVTDVQGFFAEHSVPVGEKTLAQILERQRVNAAVRKRETDVLATELARR